MSQSFANQNDLKFVITLGVGTFGSSSSNTITLQGFRATANIDKAGGMMMGTLRAQIFGVSQSDMNSITTVQWKPTDFIKNTIQVFAIDGDQSTLVFTGNIVNAWGNYDNMPDAYLDIQAQAAYSNKLQAVPPTSYQGAIDPVVVMKQLADTMGLTFENNGVVVNPLVNHYMANTALEQARELAQAAGFWMYIDNGTLAITPVNQPRNKPVPLISEFTGMKGFPTFDGVGVNFEILFNPSVTFGGSVQIQTSIPRAAGVWIATSIGLALSSAKPGGPWHMRIRGTKTGLALAS